MKLYRQGGRSTIIPTLLCTEEAWPPNPTPRRQAAPPEKEEVKGGSWERRLTLKEAWDERRGEFQCRGYKSELKKNYRGNTPWPIDASTIQQRGGDVGSFGLSATAIVESYPLWLFRSGARLSRRAPFFRRRKSIMSSYSLLKPVGGVGAAVTSQVFNKRSKREFPRIQKLEPTKTFSHHIGLCI
jgi:hypothetical protein